MTRRLGIDIGSKTAKLALLDEAGNVLYSRYAHHRSQVQKTLVEMVHQLRWQLGDMDVAVAASGSAGLRVAEVLGVAFVQEVIALKRAVQASAATDVDAILEMGGEDTKLVYLSGPPEQRMNNICAGGTGSFIEMVAGLMGERVEEVNRLALGYHAIYPIASRCAVFAKSDVRPLLNAGVSKADIAASALEAVCAQAVAGLSAGRPLAGKVLLLGGPFEHIPALRDAFCRVTGFDRGNAEVPEDAHLFVARGAALCADGGEVHALSDLEAFLRDASFESAQGVGGFSPLFADESEYRSFLQRHDRCRLPRATDLSGSRDLFLGIDAGSTTMKMALVDEQGALVAYRYQWNEGDIASSFSKMLGEIYEEAHEKLGTCWMLRGACIAGYGEEFCKAGFLVDHGEVETVAHLRAALALEPQVDFVLDIGGQDIKCLYVEDGLIVDVTLNEACSSGCGSLFDSVARSLHRTKETFAGEALYASSPVDLGTRCATFIDSRVKHAQKEGVAIQDIAAGVCYATVRNALFKVVRQPDFTRVGKRVVVQGGAFANDALLRAFELETGVEVIRPDLSALMGAWGAALLERDRWLGWRDDDPQEALRHVSTLLDGESLAKLQVSRRAVRCNRCANCCQLALTEFNDVARAGETRVFVTGNRCERGALAWATVARKPVPPVNLVAAKRALLGQRRAAPPAGDSIAVPKRVIGIPRVLALFESYPFFKVLFETLGFAVVASDASSDSLFRKGMAYIPSEGACYPSKLMWGHVVDVLDKQADLVFMPQMGTYVARQGLLAGSFDSDAMTCPVVEYAGRVLLDNCDEGVLRREACLCPDFTHVRGFGDMAAALAGSLAEHGMAVPEDAVLAACMCAQAAYRERFERLRDAQRRVLARIDAGECDGVVLMGHAYHADSGINHKIDDLVNSMGYAVLEGVDYGAALAGDASDLAAGEAEWCHWAENDGLWRAIRLAEQHPRLLIVMLRSFGCGIDALAADAVRAYARERNMVYAELKIDQIVDLAAVRIRLRSLAYAAMRRADKVELRKVAAPLDAAEYQRRAVRKRQQDGLEGSSDAPIARDARKTRIVSPIGTRIDEPREHHRISESMLTADAGVFAQRFKQLAGGIGTEPPASVVAEERKRRGEQSRKPS